MEPPTLEQGIQAGGPGRHPPRGLLGLLGFAHAPLLLSPSGHYWPPLRPEENSAASVRLCPNPHGSVGF
ncbi:Hypothetical protein AA314_09942 [Archangium gephyra]|uniref:Uncharacterized protein n=1 Tax=Archangium gephyra TaxID=48 RepID=A0AAC8QJF2_9BACT|nr:Hypothetical protein AA314_09942 [Archangium gephyra]